MKNAGIAIGLSMLGLGIAINGLNINGNQASATPSAYNAGPEEPTIVWYDVYDRGWEAMLYRAWSDGTIEARVVDFSNSNWGCSEDGHQCSGPWIVISSPTEGLNAAADINFDEIVDGADMGLLLGNWGKAPRRSIPASDCPLGLMQ